MEEFFFLFLFSEKHNGTGSKMSTSVIYSLLNYNFKFFSSFSFFLKKKVSYFVIKFYMTELVPVLIVVGYGGEG